MPATVEMLQFTNEMAKPGALDPDGWAAAAHEAAARGEISVQQATNMMVDYTGPALDTTIFAITSAIALFAQNPDQWTLLRNDPSLLRHAINEVLRLESPIQKFTRLSTRDYVLDGVEIPSGSRVLLLYGSANRDGRKYPEPERFDISRKPSDHVAFGVGEHACPGMHLARLEMASLLEQLIPRVERFELIDAELAMNNTLRGLRRLDVRVVPAVVPAVA
jgi:cytochrome P450